MALIKAARRKKRVFFRRYSLLLLNFEAKAKCNQLQHRLTTAIGVTTRKCANCPAAAAVLAYKKKRNIINWSYQQQADNIVGKMTIAALDAEIWGKEKAALCSGDFPDRWHFPSCNSILQAALGLVLRRLAFGARGNALPFLRDAQPKTYIVAGSF